ncbi:MAG: hypothetical protein IIZ83_07065 [Oscillospiraceae bacterium]|nr:hypothetical protein [Oscillospiraceae bacterium]
MIYKAPFTAIITALYGAISPEECPIGIDWFDSAAPIEEIESLFRDQAEFAYGIFGTSDADCTPNKDSAIWEASLRLEIYSNYKGRKVVADKLEALLNYLSSDAGYQAIQTGLNDHGFALVSIRVGGLRVNLPIFSENGVWQSGSTDVVFKLNQL